MMIFSDTSFATLLSYVFVTLLVMAASQSIAGAMGRTLHGWKPTLILGIASVFMVCLPVGGLPVARWLASLNADFSIPLTVILFSRVFENGLHIRLFNDTDRLTAWVFGLTAGISLYPMTLGLSRFDPYMLGWEFSWFFVLLLAVTLILLFMKNRFSVVLMISILAYDFGLLESSNLWDYLVDPFYAILSGAIICKRLGRRVVRSQKRPIKSGKLQVADKGVKYGVAPEDSSIV